MRTQKADIRELLAESLKHLTKDHSFAKITVKDITDEAKVSRPTFYNHFQDKYSLLEWIFETDVVAPVKLLLDNEMTNEALILLFSNIKKERDFYQNVFQTEGQTCFEEIVRSSFRRVLTEIFTAKINPDKVTDFWQTPENLAHYYSWALQFALMTWIESEFPVSPRKMAEILHILMTTALEDIVERLEDGHSSLDNNSRL